MKILNLFIFSFGDELIVVVILNIHVNNSVFYKPQRGCEMMKDF